MGIINRDKDISERRIMNYEAFVPANTAQTLVIYSASYPCILEQIVLNAVGLSGSPVLTPLISRFIPGVGLTAITGLGATTTVSAEFGTSGPVGMSLISQSASNASLLLMQAGDVLSLVTTGANTAIGSLCVNVIVKPTQDIKSYFGVSAMLGFFAG